MIRVKRNKSAFVNINPDVCKKLAGKELRLMTVLGNISSDENLVELGDRAKSLVMRELGLDYEPAYLSLINNLKRKDFLRYSADDFCWMINPLYYWRNKIRNISDYQDYYLSLPSYSDYKKESSRRKKFWVYIHTCPDGRKYVGSTCQEKPELRWQGGEGYLSNPEFYQVIRQVGWDNIQHEVREVKTWEEMRSEESRLIEELGTLDISKGFNRKS